MSAPVAFVQVRLQEQFNAHSNRCINKITDMKLRLMSVLCLWGYFVGVGFFVNNDEKIVFIDCCKDYPSANFGKGFGETLFCQKKVFPGNRQVKIDFRGGGAPPLEKRVGFWYDRWGENEWVRRSQDGI